MDSSAQTFTPVASYDYIIVGAGPGGLQMGHLMEKAGKNYIILERNAVPGSAFVKFPRHRKLISINKRFNLFPEDEFNMRHDWNSLLTDHEDLLFTKYSDELFPNADTLVDYLNDFATKLNIKIKYGVTITKITRTDDSSQNFKSRFQLLAGDGQRYQCHCLLMATGPLKENLPDIEGIEHADTYAEHDIDQKKYENKVVNIIGAGNSGMETADHLCGHAGVVLVRSRTPIKMSWDTHFVGNIRAVNNNILDMWHLKSMHFVDQLQITKIKKREDGKLDVDYEMKLPAFNPPGTLSFTEEEADHVIVCTGWKYIDKDLFDGSCMPKTHCNDKYPILDHTWETTVPDLFFIGTSMQSCDRRVASGFIHGFRYNIRTLFHMLQLRYHQTPLPCTVSDYITTTELAKKFVARLSTTSALYQMGQGFLCDIVALEGEGDTFKRVTSYPELRQCWVKKQKFFLENPNICILSLEDGHDRFGQELPLSVFSTMPDMNVCNQPCSAFIRPVLRRFRYGELVDTAELNGNPIVRLDTRTLGNDNFDKMNHRWIENFLRKSLGADPLPDVKLFDDDIWQNNFREWSTEEQKQHANGHAKFFRAENCLSRKIHSTA